MEFSEKEKELLKNPNIFYDASLFEFDYHLSASCQNITITTDYEPCFKDFRKFYKYDSAISFECFFARCQDKKTALKPGLEAGAHNRKCIIIIHGFQSKQKKIYLQFASRYAKMGLDCVVYSLPFHFERKNAGPKETGDFIDTSDFRVTFELFRQSVIELQVLIKVLKIIGYSQVGTMGFSFGGYCCSILSCIDRNLDFAIPLATIGDFSSLLIFKKGKSTLNDYNEKERLNKLLAEKYIGLICPVYLYPVIDIKKIMLIQGIFDHRAPVSDVAKLRKKWDYPKVIWYPCDHFTFFIFNRLTLKISFDFIEKLEKT